MATIQDVLLGDFDMTKASLAVQEATAEALVLHFTTNTMTRDEALNVARFMREVPPEPCIKVWASMQAKPANLFMIHPLVWQIMLEGVTG